MLAPSCLFTEVGVLASLRASEARTEDSAMRSRCL